MKSLFFKICFVAGCSMFMFGNCNKSTDTPGESYIALTTGSTFTYLFTPGGPSTFTVTNRDSVALGHTYKVLTNSNGPNNYQAKIGNDYYRFGVFAALGTTGLEELYLKDGQAVNATWSANQTINAPGIPIPLTATLSYSVKEKGISRTVSGKAFSNVIHIRLDVIIPGLGSLGGGDFYYAQGVGLIESTLAIAVPGQPAINQTQVLTSYTIK